VIFHRFLINLMIAAAFSSGAAVAVVASAFALYALTAPTLGRAGAAGVVALATAIVMVLGGLLLAWANRRARSKAASTPVDLLERAIAFIRQKPILAASAAVGAGLMAVRNPKYLGEVMRAFFSGDPKKS
jgi:hypothetical protein